tara:strand:- start:812 stop:1318 length:507 start_codon:yes stop_codon:yes gene_type:complete
MSVPNVSGLARQYIAGFEGDDFVPKTLEQAGLLSDAGKTLMASIPATNLAAEVAAMKGGMTLEQQKGINETAIAIQEMKDEQTRKRMILDQLGGTNMAGTALSAFLGGGGGGFDLGSMLGNIGDTSSPSQTSAISSDVDSVLAQVDELPVEGKAKLLKRYNELLQKNK